MGFLLINSLNLSENDIRGMLSFTQGSIAVTDVKSWCRKHVMKLLAKEVGAEKTKLSGNKSSSVYSLAPDEEDPEDDELYAMEELLRELQPGEDAQSEMAESELIEDGEVLDEHEAKEVLSTMIAQKKKTFMQSLRTKKAKALARGFGQWRDKGGTSRSSNSSNMSTTGYVKSGFYRMSLSEAKAKSRCSKCHQIGHWHKDPECPRNQSGNGATNKPKEINYLEKGKVLESDEGIFCGLLDVHPPGLHPGQGELSEKRAANEPGEESGNPDSQSFVSSHFGQVVTVGAEDLEPSDRQSEFGRVYKDHCESSCDVCGSLVSGPQLCSNDGCGKNRGKEHELFYGVVDGLDRTGSDSTPDELCATIDTGCQRMAIGVETLKKLDAALPDGLHTVLVPQEHRFRSVHGTSSTNFVAVIPTSLGPRGSLLRPAVFSNKESCHAPFLISLPFLLFCRAILVLDEQQGLRIHFKRFGFSVNCHLGPTGALRVPLNQFSSKNLQTVKRAQQDFQNQGQEFEVFRTTSIRTGILGSRTPPQEPASNHCLGDGIPRCDEATTTEREHGGRTRDGVAPNYPEVAHGGGECHGARDSLGASSTRDGAAILGVANQTVPPEEDSGRREHVQLPDGGGRDRRGESVAESYEVQFGDPNIAMSQSSRISASGSSADRDGDVDDGRLTTVSSSGRKPTVGYANDGTELRTSLLALSPTSRKSMQLLRMDSGPTAVGAVGNTAAESGINYTADDDARLPAHANLALGRIFYTHDPK